MSHKFLRPGPLWVLLFLVFFLIPQIGEAKRFTSSAGDFSVNFPSKPVEGSANKKTYVGTIREVWWEAKSARGNFLVGYTHLPSVLVFLGGHNTILHKAKEIFLDREGAQQVSFTDKVVDGRNAKVLVFKKTSGEAGKAYFIFEKHRVYLVVATSPQGAPVIDNFLTSFRLAVETRDQPAVDI